MLAGTMGFCNGVRHALDTVEQELALGHVPLYVLHEIVHNNFVVEDLRARGVTFVNDPDEVPDGGYLVLSAHGTAPAVRERAAARLHVTDATCPLVRKVQRAAVEAERSGARIILLGHPGHPEVAGIQGHCRAGAVEVAEDEAALASLAPEDGRPLSVLSQTTLNVDDAARLADWLKKRFSCVRDQAEVCYATRDRQQAVRVLARQVEYMLILGSSHSSNSRRLQETAAKENIPARLIDGPAEIPFDELEGIARLGLSAGASVPDVLIADTVAQLTRAGFVEAPLSPA